MAATLCDLPLPDHLLALIPLGDNVLVFYDRRPVGKYLYEFQSR